MLVYIYARGTLWDLVNVIRLDRLSSILCTWTSLKMEEASNPFDTYTWLCSFVLGLTFLIIRNTRFFGKTKLNKSTLEFER